MTPRGVIEEFLKCRRLALVGVSGDGKHFSRMVWEAFKERGYEAIPVNPKLAEVGGARCFAKVSEIRPPVEAVLVMTPPEAVEGIVRDCAEARVTRVWMHKGGGGKGSVDTRAAAWCREHDMAVVEGECPFMFLKDAGWFHGIHRFLRRWEVA